MKRRALLATACVATTPLCSGCLGSLTDPHAAVTVDGIRLTNGDTDRHEFQIRLERDATPVHESTQTLHSRGRHSPDTVAGTNSADATTASSRPADPTDESHTVSLPCTWPDEPGVYTVRTRADDGTWHAHTVFDGVSTDATHAYIDIEYRPQEADPFAFFELINETTLTNAPGRCSYFESEL